MVDRLAKEATEDMSIEVPIKDFTKEFKLETFWEKIIYIDLFYI